MIRTLLPALFAATVFLAGAARADDVPFDKQKGVRGRVVVAQELLTSPAALSPAREKALRGSALVRRPVGRALRPLLEPAPALVVMLEGDGIRQEDVPTPTIRFEGRRFLPGSLVMPRAGVVHIENHDAETVTIVDEGGSVLAKLAGGAAADANLRTGDRTLSTVEMPYATAAVKVLDQGRVLPLKGNEIPLTDIPGGEYTLTFFFGAEPLRIQPLQVPDQGLVFIDATVSALKVVEVSIKDASMRIAVPPSGLPKEDGTP